MTGRCVLLGAGGHAAVVTDGVGLRDGVELVGVIVPAPSDVAQHLRHLPVLGVDEELERVREMYALTHFAVGVGSAGDNRLRRRLFDHGLRCGLQPMTFIHPSAIVSAQAKVAAGCQLLPGAIVNPGAVLGANVIVNSGAIVEHDCVLGDHSHVATGGRLAGGVHVGEGAHIGAGATVLQGRTIGDWAVVGAGAVVTRNVEASVTVAGVPARPLRS